MISYQTDLNGLTADRLQGFFVGWPNPPRPHDHLQILRGSSHVVLAVDEAADRRPVVGFINALSDGLLMAFIPLLEVLPAYQGQGIGRELTGRLLARLKNYYAVDLMCDPELNPFYERFGLQPYTGMIKRNRDNRPKTGDWRPETRDGM